MHSVKTVVKTTALLAGLFGFVGCGGTCCESDAETIKSETPSPKPNGITNITPKGDTNEEEKIPLEPDAVANDIYDLIEVKPCEVVNFSDIGSYDPDANLTYKWTGLGTCHMSDESSFDHRFDKVGLYEATLTVTNEQNLTAFDRVCVLVGISEADMPLVADAGIDQEISSEQNVTLSGRAICRNDVASFQWKEGDAIISNESTFSSDLLVGEHILKLFIEDSSGNRASDSVIVTVK